MYRLIPLVTLVAVVACSGSDATGIVAADIACPTPQTLTYANFGQQVIADNCLECHETDERPFLDTQARVLTNASKIIRDAVFSSYMPNEGSMTTALRTQLGQWLTCGAP